MLEHMAGVYSVTKAEDYGIAKGKQKFIRNNIWWFYFWKFKIIWEYISEKKFIPDNMQDREAKKYNCE